jgi:hypothetical protein
MTRPTLAEGWLELERAAYTNVGSVQREECRRAFYAGAMALWSAMMGGLTEDREPTLEDQAHFEALAGELLEYGDSLNRAAGTLAPEGLVPSPERSKQFLEDLWAGRVTKDWLKVEAAFIDCPHCHQILRVVDVDGPYAGTSPFLNGPDHYYRIQLADGFWARLWKHQPQADAV